MGREVKILVTGAQGFVGRNLVSELKNRGYDDIFEYDKDSDQNELNEHLKSCEFIFHLAGVNRPENNEEFMEGNFGFTSELLEKLDEYQNYPPILITSSIQAQQDNPYGKSKKAGEDLIFSYGKDKKTPVFVYRLANLFGKWSRPNYNSVVATFCHNIARGEDIQINAPDALLTLSYIDDVVEEFIKALEGQGTKNEHLEGFYHVPVEHEIKLQDLAHTIKSFKESRDNLFVPNMGNPLVKKLYSTYLSYLPKDEFSYELKMNVDPRGSFTEFLKTKEYGQVSVNVSKPGITKGNHWHHTKNEKFLVVSGKGLIRFRNLGTDEIIDYHVSGDKLEVVDIPTGYTHSIVNEGDTDLVTVMWANETFDPEKPDTFYLEV